MIWRTVLFTILTAMFVSCEDPISSEMDKLNDAIDKNTQEIDKFIQHTDSIPGKISDTLQETKDRAVKDLTDNALDQ